MVVILYIARERNPHVSDENGIALVAKRDSSLLSLFLDAKTSLEFGSMFSINPIPVGWVSNGYLPAVVT